MVAPARLIALVLLCVSLTASAGILRRTPSGYSEGSRTISGARNHLVVDESGKAVGYYSDGRALERTINGTSTVDAGRFGQVALDLVRNLAWPVNLVLSAYDMVCQTSDICLQNGQWQKKVTQTTGPDLGGGLTCTSYWPQSGQASTCYIGSVRCNASLTAATYISGSTTSPGVGWTGPTRSQCTKSQGAPADADPVYIWNKTISSGTSGTTTTYRPATPQDWDSAGPMLADKFGKVLTTPDAEPWIKAMSDLAPIPVNLDWPSQSWQTDPVVKTYRDSSGNVTKTESEIVKATTDPVSNSTSIPFKETKTLTITPYLNGQPQPSDTQTQETPGSQPQNEPTVELDTVDETDLQRQEVGNFSYTPAGGGGTCPPDPTISGRGWTLTIPGHVLCDYAAQLKAIVLLVGALAAAYIVAGARRDT